MLSTWVRRLAELPASSCARWRRPLTAGAHLLWPWRCPLCGQADADRRAGAACRVCLQAITNDLVSTYCTGCGREFTALDPAQARCGSCQSHPMAFEGIAVAGRHRNTLRQAIVRWKFGRCLRLMPLLVDLLSDASARQPWYGQVEAFVPVPQPWTRRLSRRLFWPVGELAASLSARAGLPVWPRARRHRPQVGLSRAVRLQNTTNVFYVPSGVDLAGRRVCLLDDVSTTGATLNGAAKALRGAGAAGVWALVVAKTLGVSR